MDITSVAERLSVGADAPPAGVGDFDVVFLVSAQHQHVGELYSTKVVRCPLPDNDPPSLDTLKRAQDCAEKVAFLIDPFVLPFEIFRRFVRPDQETVSPEPRKVLVTCEAGDNRSIFVAGCALVLTGQQPNGKAAREYLQLLRGPQAFENVGLRMALDRFWPKELEQIRPDRGKDLGSRGIILR